jgi:hypothetical protein
MIPIDSLIPNDIGTWVVFLPTGQRGRIKSWNDTTIFVVYSCDGNWQQYQHYTAEATHPATLIRSDELAQLAITLRVDEASLLEDLAKILSAYPNEEDPTPT